MTLFRRYDTNKGMPTKSVLRLTTVLLWVLGTVALYFGFAMSFLVPGLPGEPYFQKDRILLGNLPLAVSVILLCIAAWLFRSWTKSKVSLDTAVMYSIGAAVVSLLLFAMVGAAVYQR
jgi:hypothetical protein